MVEQNSVSAVQFISAIIALAVALTGWVTLILTNRRLRAERPIAVIKEIKRIRSGGYQIIVENVGVGTALNIVIETDGDVKLFASALRTGEYDHGTGTGHNRSQRAV